MSNKPSDSQRTRLTTSDLHSLNIPPPPHAFSSSTNMRVSPIPGNFNLPPPPSSSSSMPISDEAMSAFQKERLHDVLQQGLGTYVYIENYGLVPKLNYF